MMHKVTILIEAEKLKHYDWPPTIEDFYVYDDIPIILIHVDMYYVSQQDQFGFLVPGLCQSLGSSCESHRLLRDGPATSVLFWK